MVLLWSTPNTTAENCNKEESFQDATVQGKNASSRSFMCARWFELLRITWIYCAGTNAWSVAGKEAIIARVICPKLDIIFISLFFHIFSFNNLKLCKHSKHSMNNIWHSSRSTSVVFSDFYENKHILQHHTQKVRTWHYSPLYHLPLLPLQCQNRENTNSALHYPIEIWISHMNAQLQTSGVELTQASML